MRYKARRTWENIDSGSGETCVPWRGCTDYGCGVSAMVRRFSPRLKVEVSVGACFNMAIDAITE